MKHKLLAGALALLVLLGCVTIGWAGSQADPLISLDYLNGTYLAGLKTVAAQRAAQDTQDIYDAAVSKAVQSSAAVDGWFISLGFVAGEGKQGDTVTLALGSGLIWASGGGTVSSGTLVDATVGVELPAGQALTVGHRYLAAADGTVVAASSQSVQWLAEGKWQTGAGGAAAAPLPFTDVPEGQWYYDDVRFVVERKLFQGRSETLFAPGDTMERGMMTTVLHRLAGEPEAAYTQAFTDIPDGLWYTRGTIWCARMGIVNGMGDGLFDPGGAVTRQQIAVMIYNYAVKTGRSPSERGDLSAYPDAGDVAPWAEGAMSWAVGAGILTGSDGKLLPGDGAQRAQVAAMLHRFQSWLDAQ